MGPAFKEWGRVLAATCLMSDNEEVNNRKERIPRFTKYQIQLLSKDLILSSVIWLQPPGCLYEEWMKATVAHTATRQNSSIQVQVQTAAWNTTYAVPNKLKVPQCVSPLGELPPSEYSVLQVGPDLIDLNDTQVRNILPGTAYTIRYVLYENITILASTNWSQPFTTRGLVKSPREMYDYLEGRSGGMVVITVLLSISMFMLLVGLAVTFAARQK
ncbi:uncharacterized protein [Hyperolius riggenbachi]|uniref:uncharacterized protein n=1 Tax=Hyperolius riggenbachi TaxID=752182 RepID=UPI0035A3AC4A